MSKSAVFTLKLEQDLRDDFLAAAQASDRPASQVVRELMRDYVERYQHELDYTAFLRAKVRAARDAVVSGDTRSNEDVAAEFAAMRAASGSDG